MEKYEGNIMEVYNYVNQSLSFVEAKNGVMVALCSGLIVGVFSLWEQWAEHEPVWFCLAFVPALAALACSLISFYPIRNKKVSDPEVMVPPEKINIFRCEGIA